MTEGDDILSRFFSSKSKYVKDDKTQKSVKGIFTRCRMTVKNINKNTSAKKLQPERKTGFKLPEKPADFLIRALRVCERATLESRKGHSCNVTVAFLQARSGPFKFIFSPKFLLIKFKLLIVTTLEASPKIAHLRLSARSLQISQTERPKTNK